MRISGSSEASCPLPLQLRSFCSPVLYNKAFVECFSGLVVLLSLPALKYLLLLRLLCINHKNVPSAYETAINIPRGLCCSVCWSSHRSLSGKHFPSSAVCFHQRRWRTEGELVFVKQTDCWEFLFSLPLFCGAPQLLSSTLWSICMHSKLQTLCFCELRPLLHSREKTNIQ